MYTLHQDGAFSPDLEPGKSWQARGRSSTTRGFTDDGENIAADKRQTAQQKVAILEMMLGQIANYCPVISRNTIAKSSKSISQIYQTIRLHYGFQSSGAQFIDFADIKLEPDERHEDLYQRIVAFVEDNLLQKDSNIKHHDVLVTEDEEMSPLLENMIVLTWLRLIHPGLPKLVKQRYGTELRPRTLASIKAEISQALDSLIDEHFCQAVPTFTPNTEPEIYNTQKVVSYETCNNPDKSFSSSIKLDPNNQLETNVKQKFLRLHKEYDNVFNPAITGHNGAMGPCYATVNMGPVQPPQRKGRVPQYSRDKLKELQEQFDTLEALGVFKRPADIGICVEYLNPSFLIKKPNGGHRLVTAFADVGRYSKPQPSLMPDVDSTLRQIGKWKYIIVTDLSKAFYQIPLSKDSMKYCGVATPFKGVRVYV